MKSNFNKVILKFMGIIPAIAMIMATQSASATCFYCLHQPDVPEELQD